VGEALLQTVENAGADEINYDAAERPLVDAFLDWYYDPDNNYTRAPGGTCLKACGRLAKHAPWWEATDPKSKGCGANMRVTMVGLANGLTQAERSGFAQLQSAVTHAHPTALAAADATQQAVWLLNNGTHPDDLLDALLDYVDQMAGTYPTEWLGELYTWTNDHTELTYARRGWLEVQARLLDVVNAMYQPVYKGSFDPCKLTGAGWTAETCLSTALHCFLLYPKNGQLAIARAAATSGDSDSIAAITGALAGAWLGEDGFPSHWADRIEYAPRLRKLADALS